MPLYKIYRNRCAFEMRLRIRSGEPSTDPMVNCSSLTLYSMITKILRVCCTKLVTRTERMKRTIFIIYPDDGCRDKILSPIISVLS